MGVKVNPLIFRSKNLPFYRNLLNNYFGSSNNYRLLCLVDSSRNFGRRDVKSLVAVNVISKYTFLVLSLLAENTKYNKNYYCLFHRCIVGLNVTNYNYSIFKVKSVTNSTEFIITYILTKLNNQKISIRTLLTKLTFVLVNIYKLKGLKCIISGRIKGIQRAKTEIFRFGENSVKKENICVKYNSSDLFTNYGKLGVKL